MDMLVNVMKEAGEFGEGLPIPAISRPRERCQPPLDCSWSHSQRTSLDGASSQNLGSPSTYHATEDGTFPPHAFTKRLDTLTWQTPGNCHRGTRVEHMQM